MKTYQAGIDVGSTTVKLVVLDENGKMLFGQYQRHLSHTQRALSDLLKQARAALGECALSLRATGSGAINLAKALGVPFVQEVVAVAQALQRVAPQVDVAIELGGEDAKIIYFKGGLEERMNGVCAGGTGSFIDQMAALLQTDASGLDREAALADMRFNFIERLCDKTVVRPGESREHKRSVAIDKVLTGKYTALPCFIGIMALVFWLTFGVIGAGLSDLLTLGIDALTDLTDRALTAYGINPVVHSLVIDGVFAGVGSVLSFLPIIVTLFFFLSILEDTGYMARVAFVMDQLLRRIGLSGRSFVPMLIGFGCSVPAIMATRTLSSDRDRKMTILLTPFMSCSAKLPIYALFTTAFFPRQYRALVMIGLYLTGIVCGILYALLLKLTKYKGEPVPFVMELPNYRFPSARSVGQLIWEKARDFLQKAFTIIFVATVLIWFLQTFDARLNVAATPDASLLAAIGSFIAPVFAPLGFGDWRVSTALITGFTAKESVVSTLTVLLGGDTGALSTMFTPFTAVVFLVFTLLYTPCVAAVAAVKRELGGSKAAAGVVLMQCAIAWVVAFVVHLVGGLFGLV